MSSSERGGGQSNVVYVISSAPTTTTIIVIVVILVVVIAAFVLSVTCYCYSCRIQKPRYTRLMNGLLPQCNSNLTAPNTPALPDGSSLSFLTSSSDRVVPSHRLPLKPRRAVSLGDMVTIELPTIRDNHQCESEEISPDSLSSDSLESGLRRTDEIPKNHVLLNCEHESNLIRSKGSSPINEEVIIHNERSTSSASLSSSSLSSIDLKLVKHKEKSQMSECSDTPKKLPDPRKYRVLPKNDVEWSDEITADKGKRKKHNYTRPPRIVPTHLQGRDIEWTDDTDLDVKQDILPVDIETAKEVVIPSERENLSPINPKVELSQEGVLSVPVRVVDNFVDSSDDEYHSTHSDISVEDLSKIPSDTSIKSAPTHHKPIQMSENTVQKNCGDIESKNDIKANGDINLPIEKLNPDDDLKPLDLSRSDSNSSPKSGNLTSKSLTLPTKHLVL